MSENYSTRVHTNARSVSEEQYETVVSHIRSCEDASFSSLVFAAATRGQPPNFCGSCGHEYPWGGHDGE